MNIKYRLAKTSDLEKLVEIRVESMTPSLKEVGRFNLERAKERLISNFTPSKTVVGELDGEIVGFFMISHTDENIKLEHLYIKPGFQGIGLGTVFMDKIKLISIKNNKDIYLEALKKSKANKFYNDHGFIKIDEKKFDNIYYWKVTN